MSTVLVQDNLNRWWHLSGIHRKLISNSNADALMYIGVGNHPKGPFAQLLLDTSTAV